MTARQFVGTPDNFTAGAWLVHCDVPGCRARLKPEGATSSSAARLFAGKSGWGFTEIEDLDVCPAHVGTAAAEDLLLRARGER